MEFVLFLGPSALRKKESALGFFLRTLSSQFLWVQIARSSGRTGRTKLPEGFLFIIFLFFFYKRQLEECVVFSWHSSAAGV